MKIITHEHPKKHIGTVLLSAALLPALILTSCTEFDRNKAAHNGTMKTGLTVLGGISGGILGHQKGGHGLQGAIIGAGVGAIGGQMIQERTIRSADQNERQVANDRLRQVSSGR
ncbi:hypothetical protein [Prosthecobacter sp.]|uniref:hypothetical protein n=1 Tax=Prosthecobacter sp. TaxID=1965333 RepID=UPI0037838930